jgi:hypothetical protein
LGIKQSVKACILESEKEKVENGLGDSAEDKPDGQCRGCDHATYRGQVSRTYVEKILPRHYVSFYASKKETPKENQRGENESDLSKVVHARALPLRPEVSTLPRQSAPVGSHISVCQRPHHVATISDEPE